MKKRKFIINIIFMFILIFTIFGCSNNRQKNIDEVINYTSYLDIPDISADEIAAIKELQNEYKVFVYGVPVSTEAFFGRGGEIKGFAELFCNWLTNLFGIRFKPVNYEFANLLPALETGEVDFAGGLAPTEGRKGKYYMTDAFIERSLAIYRIEGSQPLSEIRKNRKLKFVFLKDSATTDLAISLLDKDSYKAVFVERNIDARKLIETGKADGFIHQNTTDILFNGTNIISEDFVPPAFISVCLTARKDKMAPIISVVQKALKNGQMKYIANLYKQSEHEYAVYKLFSRLSEKEIQYIKEHPVIPIVSEYNNYPVSFYNKYEKQWQGISCDILKQVSDLTGMSFNIINGTNADQPALLQKLNNGQAVMLSGLIRSADKEQYFTWTNKAILSDKPSLISKYEYHNIGLNEILHLKIGLVKGTAYSEIFKHFFPYHTNIVEYKDVESLFDAFTNDNVDMVFLGESSFLNLTNYKEIAGYKKNIIFDSPVEYFLGFNKDEEVLSSIINKAMDVIDTDKITYQWMRKTYDYRAKVAEARLPWVKGVSFLLLCVSALIVILIKRKSSEDKNKNTQKMMKEISEVNERIDLLLNAMPIGCHLWNRNLEIFYCNEENFRLFNLKDKQEFFENFFKFAPEYQPGGQPSREKAVIELKRAFDEGERVFEFMHCTSDGALIPAEITLVRVAYKNDYAVAAYVRDLREQKKMITDMIDLQEKLKEENINTLMQFEMIWDNVESGIVIIDTETRAILDANPAASRMFGGERREMIGKTCHKFFGENKCPIMDHNHSVDREERKFIKSDGTVIPILKSIAKIQYNGRPALLESFTDISYLKAVDEQKHMLEVAEQSSKAKSSFLANMSHEMRTPLNAVIGLTQLNLGNSELTEETRSNLEKVYNAGTTLLGIVNDVLDISKIESGKLDIVDIDYDVPSLINDTVTQNILRIGEKPIEFKLDVGEDIYARLYGDELRLKQIMNNLLSNAIKYTQQGSVELGLYCEREGNTVWLTIKVSDTGKGIPPEDMGKLFSDYFQADVKANRKIEGTGLGLSITKRLAEMMGGTLTAESEYGKGSIFTAKIAQMFISDVRIGRRIVENLKNFRYSDEKRNQSMQFRRTKLPFARVLVVDDNITNLDVVKGLMKPYEMKVDCVTSGQEAVDAILTESFQGEKVKYDAVFMDHMMPGMDGMEATRLIREIDTDYARDIPIIALTANAIAGNEKVFLSNGFQAFLLKPIDISRLDEVIRYWIRDKYKEKEFKENEIQYQNTSEGKTARSSRFFDQRITGLNIAKGIELFDDEDIYLQILRSYITNTRPLLDSITNLSEDKLSDYAITVHGIKGASLGVYATAVGVLAGELEQAAKSRDLDFINNNNTYLLAAAKKLIADIENLLSAVDTGNIKLRKDNADIQMLEGFVSAYPRRYRQGG